MGLKLIITIQLYKLWFTMFITIIRVIEVSQTEMGFIPSYNDILLLITWFPLYYASLLYRYEDFGVLFHTILRIPLSVSRIYFRSCHKMLPGLELRQKIFLGPKLMW